MTQEPNGQAPTTNPGGLLAGIDPADIIDVTPPPEQLRPKPFRVGPRDEDVFVAAASVPVLTGARAIRLLHPGTSEDEGDAVERTVQFLEQVLYPEYRERFHARLEDLKHPIDHRILFAVLRRLLEAWGLRPTQPSPGSSDGPSPPDDGTTSTGEPPSPAATSEPSASTGSAT
jgi:hypothetical protein